jgi:nucleoside phosphorylase/CheY-like chemotaxis protein
MARRPQKFIANKQHHLIHSMFQILIIEDQTDKLRTILQVIEQIREINAENIDTEIDIIGAKKKLKAVKYDLLILDISIPNRKSEDPQLYGGLELLNEILEREVYNVPTHIIGLTAYDEVFEKANDQLSEKILTLIKYDYSKDYWRRQLINGINQRLLAKNASNYSQEFDFDAAIICALEKEFHAVKNNGWNWEEHANTADNTIYYKAEIIKSDLGVIKIVAGVTHRMGMPAAGALAMKMIMLFRPKYIVLTGIMAGVKGRVELGDIIFPNPVWDWGSGKWIPAVKIPNSSDDDNNMNSDEEPNIPESIFEIDPFQHHLDPLIEKHVLQLKDDKHYLFSLRHNFGTSAPKHDINIRVGPVATGAAVLADQIIFDKIKAQHRKLLGIEMEAYAVFTAAENAPLPKPSPVAVKCIVDFGDFKKVDDFQEFGCYASATVATTLLNKLLRLE